MFIFGIEFVKMTTKQIAKRNSFYRNRSNGDILVRYTPLPEFVITYSKDGEAVLNNSEYMFQFVYDPDIIEDNDIEEYIMFDISLSDNMMSEEISNIGHEDFLKEIGFLECFEVWKNQLLIHDFDDYTTLKKEQLFIVNIDSYKSWSEYGYEYDYDIELVGFLDNEMNKITI